MSVKDVIQRTRQQPQRPPSREKIALAHDRLARWSNLRVDLRRLDVAEQFEAVELCTRGAEGAPPGVSRFNPDQLPARDRRRLEQLVERAANAEGAFQREREEAEARKRIEALAKEAMRPSRRLVYEQPGAVTFDAEVAQQLRDGILWIEHVGVLFAVIASFETAEPLPGCSFEGERDRLVLVVDQHRGLGLQKCSDNDELVARWRQVVEHLASLGYLQVERAGRTWRLTIGEAATKIRRGGASK